MSRRRKRSRKQGTYFLRNQERGGWGGWWVRSVTSGIPGYRYTKRFSDAMHFRNFARANRFRKPGEEIRRLVWKWWIFTKTKKVEGSND